MTGEDMCYITHTNREDGIQAPGSDWDTVNIQLDDGAYMPVREHATDAGADLRTPKAFLLPPHGSFEVDTGVHVELPHRLCARVEPKSGLNVRSGIVCFGLVDEGYSGSIVVKLYNLGKDPHYFNKGDKVAQMTICPVLYPGFRQVDEVKAGERADNGFGSTGA